ncbi:uncharacterized protein BJ212DRAFT_1312551 [Suillus subaureus]|uniref:Uncharacterized protein n=1 Tax=Suillus subaureus TaxID=48587 RepID=A0A9P7EQS8_9AGAM|nr:uncharacterized protein BJ212DRAFT_1312551 [Suillus subaureus]KAG1827468.1 hypothetical protein BJ212DRAFT_1312551 [Suillus subaureus]
MAWPIVPSLFTTGAMQIDVPTWKTIIFSNHLPSQCQLKRMICCKCRRDKQDEFLLFEFCHWSASRAATTVLVIDRCEPDPENNSNGSSTRTSGIISPLASPTSTAIDNVFTTPNINSAIQTCLTKVFGLYIKLCTLLSAVIQNTPQYLLYQNQWFAETVWEAANQLFSGGVEGPWLSGRSLVILGSR